MLKIWPKVKIMIWSEKVTLHIGWSVFSFWTHICMLFFIAQACLYQKLFLNNCWWPFMIWVLKWPWRHEEGLLVATFLFRVSSLSAARYLRVFRMVFVQKRHLSIFSHWLIPNGEVTKLAWPWVIDIKFPRCKFYRYLLRRQFNAHDVPVPRCGRDATVLRRTR